MRRCAALALIRMGQGPGGTAIDVAELKDRAADADAQVRQAALSQLARSDLPGAFREYCRAMRTITEALQRQRQKEEVFQPIWDKSPN